MDEQIEKEVGWPDWKEKVYADWHQKTGGSKEDFQKYLDEQKEKCQCGCE